MKNLKLILAALLVTSVSLFACGGEDPGTGGLEANDELGVTSSSVRQDGATCMVDCSTGSHSECYNRWYMVRHALPNVTAHCADTAALWCRNRGWSVYSVWWSHNPENRAWCY